VTLAEIDAKGQVSTIALPTPVPRRLCEMRGKLDDILAGPGGRDLADLADAWVRVVLTDTVRPPAPMERLRARWPHTLVLDFEPEGQLVSAAADLGRLAKTADPVEICELFVEFTSGGPADAGQRAVLRDVIEAVQHAEAAEVAPAEVAPAEVAEHVHEHAHAHAEAGSVDEWLADAGRDEDWMLDAELAFPRRGDHSDASRRGGNPAAA
jgi:hypothetical protein